MCLTVEAKAVIERFEAAVRAHDNVGAQDPEDRESIHAEYEAAKEEIEMWMSWIP